MYSKALGEKATLFNTLIEKGKDLLDKSRENEQQGVNAVLIQLTENWEQVELCLLYWHCPVYRHCPVFDTTVNPFNYLLKITQIVNTKVNAYV